MKNENLTLDNFIKGLRNLGVKSISLELMPNLSMPNSAVPPRSYALSPETVDHQTIDRVGGKVTATNAALEQVKDNLKTIKGENTKGPDTINADAQEIIDKDDGVLVGEKPATVEKPVTLKKSAATTNAKEIKKVDQFERFAHLVEHDDGSKENAAERKSIVNKLKLDNLLRINNEFSCGVDTDCKIGELRKTIISLF